MQQAVMTDLALTMSASIMLATVIFMINKNFIRSLNVVFKGRSLTVSLIISVISLVATFDVIEGGFELSIQEAAKEQPSVVSNIPTTATANIPDLSEFAEEIRLEGPLNLNYLENKIRDIIASTKCHKDRINGSTSFLCEASSNPDVSSCSLKWVLKPITGDGRDALAVVEGRMTVISENFSGGGYALLKSSDGGRAAGPAIGIAPVICNDETKGIRSEFRLAFVLSNVDELKKHKSAFRTRGYDWITPRYKPVPYLPEIFAMASLREISLLIRDDLEVNALVADNKRVLFGSDAIKVLRGIPRQEVTIGNNSDFQLGVSRGACVLAMRAANYALDREVQVAPSEYSDAYRGLAPSLVVFPPGGSIRSIPCPLMISWLSIAAMPEEALPDAFSSPTLKYKLGAEQQQESVWRGYAVRTAAVLLYMLGYKVRPQEEDSLEGVSGQWPRKELLTPAGAN